MADRTLRLGFLTHVSSTGDPRSALEQTSRLFQLAEELGYHSAWVAQHHVGAECGHLPSPFVFLASVAARTSRIRLGTAVVTLPLEDPIRTAEDAAVADLLSGGRIELGVGTCGHQPSFVALEHDFEHRREIQRQSVNRLAAALRGEPLPGGVPLTPTAPGLAERLWQATSSAESSRAAAEAGNGLLLARAAPRSGEPVARVQRPVAEAYLAAYARAGHRAPPRLGITRTVYPATDRQTAIAQLEAGTRLSTRQMLADLQIDDLSTDALVRLHSLYCGDAAQVVDALAHDEALPLATDLLVQVQPGLPTFAQTVRALEVIASTVAPSLGLQLDAYP